MNKKISLLVFKICEFAHLYTRAYAVSVIQNSWSVSCRLAHPYNKTYTLDLHVNMAGMVGIAIFLILSTLLVFGEYWLFDVSVPQTSYRCEELHVRLICD